MKLKTINLIGTYTTRDGFFNYTYAVFRCGYKRCAKCTLNFRCYTTKGALSFHNQTIVNSLSAQDLPTNYKLRKAFFKELITP